MRSIRQILFYRLEKQIGADQTACALKVSKGTVINTLKRFSQSGLPWPLPEDMADSTLEARLYPTSSPAQSVATDLPSIKYLEEELAKKHVTLQCLYDEYRGSTPAPLSRASFYRYFKRSTISAPSMPVDHRGGDLVYVDYSGDGLFYTDSSTGDRRDLDLFCCCFLRNSTTVP
ncbi:MAG: hypothetical protein ACLFTW_13230 [Chitinispirillaceae bacterium]